MLQLVQHPRGLAFYQSPLLTGCGLPHAFTTRRGGVSPGPWASLNLANPHAASAPTCLPSAPVIPQDDPARVRTNYQLVQQALGLPFHRLALVHQVHGAQVRVIGSETPPDTLPQADAMVTGQRGVLLAIRVADCVPVLLADGRGRAVAAIHCGWRCVVAGIIERTLATMKQHWGVQPGDILGAIGPGISADQFEVGPEVAAEFSRAGLDAAIRPPGAPGPGQQVGSGGKPHIDLAMAVSLQLARAGVGQEALDRTDRCTYRNREEFFSHRRDRGQTGRMACLIALG